MCILEFKVDEAILREDTKGGLHIANSAALQHTYFEMPVRFNVAGVELLEKPIAAHTQLWISDPHTRNNVPVQRGLAPSPWLSLPILHVATIGLERVQEAWESGTSTYSLPGGSHLSFERSGEDLIVYSGLNGQRSRANYHQILHAFLNFASEVRHVLDQAAPELRDHQHWGRWFKSELQ
ncbi:MAG: hypothetical protein M3437_11830 [Chloroflexota bacterium]|nr:hypothetical protein [Chloroflexota bacterium]MDQ5866132.1 hypothetical protein [Chloroflexota bacterium]